MSVLWRGLSPALGVGSVLFGSMRPEAWGPRGIPGERADLCFAWDEGENRGHAGPREPGRELLPRRGWKIPINGLRPEEKSEDMAEIKIRLNRTKLGLKRWIKSGYTSFHS